MGLAKNDGNIPRGKNEAERETIGLERTAVAFSKISRGEFTKGTFDPEKRMGSNSHQMVTPWPYS